MMNSRLDAQMVKEVVGLQTFETLPLCTVTAIVFFGSIIFVTASMATKCWLHGDFRGKNQVIEIEYDTK